MRVDEVIANANTLLGRQVTVEGHLVTDFHSCAYLAPDRNSRRRMRDSLGITTDVTYAHTLWHRSPVGAALNTLDDFFAMSPVLRGQSVNARIFITGTLLRTDDARFPYTLERITQVFAHADTVGCTLVYKPANSFDRAGFSDLPRSTMQDVMGRRGHYDHLQIRLSGAITGDGTDAYMLSPTFPNGEPKADQVATMELAVVPDMTGEFPAYIPVRQFTDEWDRGQAIAVPQTGLLERILPELHTTMTDVQLVGTFHLDNGYPFGGRMDNVSTLAVSLGGGVIAVWNLPRLANTL